MTDDNVRDQIAGLEDRIEALTESIERCGKIAVGAKIAIAGGAAWFALVLIWLLAFNATGFVAATSAVLGGVVLLGSNRTTREQMEAERRAAEAMRAQLIGRVEMRLVAPTPTLH